MARDDFSKPTIRKLKDRVAHRCSNPECRTPTSAAKVNDGVKNIGVAAHICAASIGGPRYNSSMTQEERKSIENGIWLCSNCSIKIDRDVDAFPAELLKNWKQQAETASRSELGKRLPNDQDTIKTVTQALSGVPHTYIHNAIHNIHEATALSLETLDPRFKVSSSFTEGCTTLKISPKEPESVSISMIVNRDSAQAFQAKNKRLIEHGEDIHIKASEFSFSGSKLFEELLHDQDSVIRISPIKKGATQKLWLVQKSTGLVASFDDIQGSIVYGTHSMSFEGSTFDNLFTISYMAPIVSGSTTTNFKISLNYEEWEKIDLTRLPFFEKIFSLFTKMEAGWELFTSLEIDGIEKFTTTGSNWESSDYVLDTNCILRYISRCRKITEKLKKNVQFTTSFSYTADEHEEIHKVAQICSDTYSFTKSEIRGNTNFSVKVAEDLNNFHLISEADQPTTIKAVTPAGQKICMFGIEIELPEWEHIWVSVKPKLEGNKDKVKPGDLVKIELVPEDDFKYYESFNL